MKKKYMSMQEELAARKAAAERERAAEQGGPSDSGLLDYSEPALLGSPEPVKDAEWEKTRDPQEIYEFRKRLAKRIFGFIIGVTVLTVMAGACIGYFTDGDEEMEEPDETWYTTQEVTRETTEQATQESSGQNGSPRDITISENSSLLDIEAYAAKKTEAIPDESVLFGPVYSELNELIEKNSRNGGWYISEGRIYIRTEPERRDKAKKFAKKWAGITDSIQQTLNKNDIDYVPVVLTVREIDGWDLMMLMIDGKTEFVSERFR